MRRFTAAGWSFRDLAGRWSGLLSRGICEDPAVGCRTSPASQAFRQPGGFPRETGQGRARLQAERGKPGSDVKMAGHGAPQEAAHMLPEVMEPSAPRLS